MISNADLEKYIDEDLIYAAADETDLRTIHALRDKIRASRADLAASQARVAVVEGEAAVLQDLLQELSRGYQGVGDIEGDGELLISLRPRIDAALAATPHAGLVSSVVRSALRWVVAYHALDVPLEEQVAEAGPQFAAILTEFNEARDALVEQGDALLAARGTAR